MPRVLIADELSPAAVRIFAERGVEADVRVGMKKDELIAIIGDYDGLAVRSATKVTAEVLAAAHRLKVVGRAGIGVDNIDVDAATQRGIVVMNTPFGNSVTTAEHAITLMLALARQIPAADRSTRAGKWEKSRFMGTELMGKTLGLIGCGNIGSIVADRAQGLKMRVIAFDPFLRPGPRARPGRREGRAGGAARPRRRDLGPHADDRADPQHPLPRQPGADQAGRADRQCRTRRPRRRGGAPRPDQGRPRRRCRPRRLPDRARARSPLFELDEVIVTPHLGASTSEAQENVALNVAEQISDYLTNGAVVNALNMPAVSAEEAPRLGPYMKLAEQLGSFAGQISETGIGGVTITYAGHAAALNTRPLTQVALAGLLRPVLASVNMVNAPAIARSRNINVTIVTHEEVENYQILVTIEVQTEQGPREVAGTLFQDQEPRLVSIRGIPLEARLGRRMLYMRNQDKPGLIGALGRTLGDAGINIATFHLGRDQPGGNAIALVEIDQPLSDDVLRQVEELPHVLQVRQLSF